MWTIGASGPAHELADRFEHHAHGVGPGELPQFRALMRALREVNQGVRVAEFHGSGHQVFQPVVTPWVRSSGRCELSDLCIIWFRTRRKREGRITFLQAKRSHRAHSVFSWFSTVRDHALPWPSRLVCDHLIHVLQRSIAHGEVLCLPDHPFEQEFEADSTQWHLLNRRPRVVGHGGFAPPPDLLSGAILPSVGSYGVFHEWRGDRTFFYASADLLASNALGSAGHCRLSMSSEQPFRQLGGYNEQTWACCPCMFGLGLYSGIIGSPFGPRGASGFTGIGGAWNDRMVDWFMSLRLTPGDGDADNAVLAKFRSAFIGNEGNTPTEEQRSDAPFTHLLLIDADELNDESMSPTLRQHRS